MERIFVIATCLSHKSFYFLNFIYAFELKINLLALLVITRAVPNRSKL